MKRRIGILFLFALTLAAPALASEFTLQFEWGNIPLCASGSPNVVANPKFVLSNVPDGTKFIQFTMTDIDVPSYDHGGGTVEYKGSNTIGPGAFTYKSPCPPGGSHRYRWRAMARGKKGLFTKPLGKAEAIRSYP